jgi:hypothetical protein
VPKGPRCHDSRWRTASNVQENKGTTEASKKGKEGGEEGEKGRQKGRYVECSTEVSICHLMPPLNQSLWALLIASLTAFIGWGVVHFSALVERERRKRHNERDRHLDMTSM